MLSITFLLKRKVQVLTTLVTTFLMDNNPEGTRIRQVYLKTSLSFETLMKNHKFINY